MPVDSTIEKFHNSLPEVFSKESFPPDWGKGWRNVVLTDPKNQGLRTSKKLLSLPLSQIFTSPQVSTIYQAHPTFLMDFQGLQLQGTC